MPAWAILGRRLGAALIIVGMLPAAAPTSRAAAPSFPIPPGAYAIAALHDENRDGKMNMTIGIPREGVGFSNNPVIGMSAPKFSAARVAVGNATIVETVRMEYFF